MDFFFFIWFNWVLLLLYILDIKKQLCRTQFYFSMKRFLFAIFLFSTTPHYLHYFPIPYIGLPGLDSTYMPLYWNTSVYVYAYFLIWHISLLDEKSTYVCLKHIHGLCIRMYHSYQTIYLKCPSFEIDCVVWGRVCYFVYE